MMKRIFVAFLLVSVAGLYTLAEGHDVTLPGDVAITGSGNGLTFPDGTKQVTANPPANLVLECVSAVLFYEPDGQPKYCSDPFKLRITNPNPTELDPYDIFSVFCESPGIFGDDVVTWGLVCNEGWMNTGCVGNNIGQVVGGDDLNQFQNGCLSDDEEYGVISIFASCCRIAVKTE